MRLTSHKWKADTTKLKGIGKADDPDEGVGEADDPDEGVGEADGLTWPCLVSTFAYI